MHPIGHDHELDEMVMTVTIIPWKPQQYRIPKSIQSVLTSKKGSRDQV